MLGSASSPGNMRRSESSQSITRPMWDSSDPTRNPSPLPLPDNHVPVSTVRTQSKISAAHKRLTTTSSSRSLSQQTLDEDSPTASLYDLVSMIHTNLEILMKRSQNNARDLGRLRGDVKNPQAIEEIKKLLQESSMTHANGDTQNPEKQREIESELAVKLDALLKSSTNQPEKATNVSVNLSSDSALMAQVTAAATSAAATATGNERIFKALDSMQTFLSDHLPVHIPEQQMVTNTVMAEPAPVAPFSVSIDTSGLQDIVHSLESQISSKIREIQELDSTLNNRRAELSSLESRTTVLQMNLANLVKQLEDSRSAEDQRQKENIETRIHKGGELRKKKSTLSKRALMPLAPSVDRRIVSLSNVGTPPGRRPAQTHSPAPSIAPPLRHESPFSQAPLVLNTSTTATDQEKELRKGPHRPMQMTLRETPPRRTSWSRRVSQIFTSGGNKENSLLNSVHEDSTASRFEKHGGTGEEKKGLNSIGRGLVGSRDSKGSMRSFRSFSHR